MVYCLVRFEDHRDGLSALGSNMANFWHKTEVLVEAPGELNSFSRIIFYRKIESFFFLYHTVVKIDFVLLFQRQIFEKNFFVVGFSFHSKAHDFELIQ